MTVTRLVCVAPTENLIQTVNGLLVGYALTANGKALQQERGLHRASMSLGNGFALMFGARLVLASFRIGVQQRSSLRSFSHQEILDHPACPESMPEPFSILVPFSVHNLFTKRIESLAEAAE
jgi:hypothetical protein